MEVAAGEARRQARDGEGAGAGPQVTAGAYETAGLRGEDSMEDRHLVVTAAAGRSDAGSALLAVFDGHRGAQAAEYARRHFLEHLGAQGAAPTAEAALRGAFVAMDEAFRRQHAHVTEGELKRLPP